MFVYFISFVRNFDTYQLNDYIKLSKNLQKFKISLIDNGLMYKKIVFSKTLKL